MNDHSSKNSECLDALHTFSVLLQHRSLTKAPPKGNILDSLGHDVYLILICDTNKHYRIIESRHITFDGNRFLVVPGLEEIMYDDGSVDHIFERSDSEASNSSCEGISEVGYGFESISTDEEFESAQKGEDVLNILETDEEDAYMEQSNTQCGGSNNDIVEEENFTAETPADTESRYPSSVHRPPQKWCMAS